MNLTAKTLKIAHKKEYKTCKNNERACPRCFLVTIKGMPGGRDSTCYNCGYKDPCCDN